jgi:hypothetical protein
MAIDRITGEDVQAMVRHWLGCPVGGYLGSDYGHDIPSILHTPLAAGLADAQVQKCRVDVPLVGALPNGAVNVYAVSDPDALADRLRIVFEVHGDLVEAGQGADAA